MQGITEAEYERALIELFQSLEGKQYRYEYGPDIERDYTNPILDVVLQYVKQKVDERFHPDGYNVGINVGEYAGQSVFHCHMHLIPRYKGDVPNPKGGVRGVIPSKQNYVVKPERKWMTNDDTPYANGYLKWEKESDDLLCHMFDEGTNLQVIAAELGRSEVAIKRRLRRLRKI